MPSLRAALLAVAHASAALTAVGCAADADVFGETSGVAAGSGGGGATGGATGGEGPGTGTGGAAGPGSTGSSGGAPPTSSSISAGGGTPSSSTGEGGATTSTASSGSTGEGGGTVASSSASGSRCGDGAIDPGEDCDGADTGRETCASLGFPGGGRLGCAVDCTFDVTDCTKCGNGAPDPGEDCDDGGVAPGDGCDPQCHFEGQSCQQPIGVEIDVGEIVVLSTTNEAGPAAPGSCLDASGPGRVVRVVPQDDGFLTAWIRRDGTTFDSSLRVGYACDPDDTFVCADSYDPGSNQQPPGGEVGSLFVQQGEPVWVFVEAWGPAVVGDFTLELTLARGRCDDPVELPVERGSPEGIAAWGFNGGQGGDAIGTCGGAGADVTYQLRAVGGASPVDVVLEPVEGFLFNPVLHAREGQCSSQDDEVDCSGSAPFGQPEEIEGLAVSAATFLHADATTGSQGGYLLRIVPPEP